MKIENFTKIFFILCYKQTISYPPRGQHTRLSEQYSRWTHGISSWTSKSAFAQTHIQFWHVFWAHMSVDANFDLGGIQPRYFAYNLVFICVKIKHTPCWCLTKRKLMTRRFPSSQTLYQIWPRNLRRWKSARHRFYGS